MSRKSRGNHPLRLSLVLGLAAIGIACGAEARTWIVHPDGSGDAPTLQAAADSSSLGDTVLATAGMHQGPVALRGDTHLVGEGAGASQITGTDVDPHVVVAFGGSVSGLSLIGVSSAYGHVGGAILSMGGRRPRLGL